MDSERWRQIEDRYHAALTREPAELSRLLDQADPEVRREVDTKLNRPVAIKFLSSEFADAAARHRFRREAPTASSLNHPHILTVFDTGEFEGRQYLVTLFVNGGTLKTWVRSDPVQITHDSDSGKEGPSRRFVSGGDCFRII